MNHMDPHDTCRNAPRYPRTSRMYHLATIPFIPSLTILHHVPFPVNSSAFLFVASSAPVTPPFAGADAPSFPTCTQTNRFQSAQFNSFQSTQFNSIALSPSPPPLLLFQPTLQPKKDEERKKKKKREKKPPLTFRIPLIKRLPHTALSLLARHGLLPR